MFFFRVSVALVAKLGLPGTRAQSRGKAGGSSTSDGNLQADRAAVEPGVSADDIEVTVQQGNMSDVVPKDLQDAQIMVLRASVTSARKLLDDIMVEVDDQLAHIKVAKSHP